MTSLETVEKIAEHLGKEGKDFPLAAILGTNSYSCLFREASYDHMIRTGYLSINVRTQYGTIIVKSSSKVPADHISVGSRTMLDIIAEEILLGVT